jgi:hypothetical protein
VNHDLSGHMRTQFDTIITCCLLLLMTRLGLYVPLATDSATTRKFDACIEANADGTFE